MPLYNCLYKIISSMMKNNLFVSFLLNDAERKELIIKIKDEDNKKKIEDTSTPSKIVNNNANHFHNFRCGSEGHFG